MAIVQDVVDNITRVRADVESRLKWVKEPPLSAAEAQYFVVLMAVYDGYARDIFGYYMRDRHV